MKKFTSVALTLALTFSTFNALGAHPPLSEEQKQELLGALTEVAVNKYFILSAKKKNIQIQQQIDGVTDSSSLDTLRKIEIGGAVLFSAAAVYSFYKAKKSNDIRLLFWGIAGLFAGGTGAGMGVDAYLAHLANKVSDNEERKKLTAQMKKNEGDLNALIERNNAIIAQIKPSLPNVNAEEEIDKIISSQAYRLPQIEQLRSNLAKLRISVHSKDEDIGVTAFFTATGLLSLVNNLKKQPVQKIGLYVSSAWTIAFGGWSAKNYVDRQKLVASVEEIEKEIDSIDEEVRANIKTDLPQLLNQ